MRPPRSRCMMCVDMIAKTANYEEGQKMFDEMTRNATSKPVVPGVSEYAGEDPNRPYEFISINATLGNDRSEGFDRSRFTYPTNYRDTDGTGLHVDLDSEFESYKGGQHGLPRGGLYASKRSSNNSSHWIEDWKRYHGASGIGQKWTNGFSFDLSPDANIYTINTVKDWQDLINMYPYVKMNDEEYTDMKDIDDIINNQVYHGDELARYGKFQMYHPWILDGPISIDWEHLYERSKADGKPIHGVYFSPLFGRAYNGVKNVHRPGGVSSKIEDKNSAFYNPLVASLGSKFEGDQLIIVHPDAIGRSKPYSATTDSRPSRADVTGKRVADPTEGYGWRYDARSTRQKLRGGKGFFNSL